MFTKRENIYYGIIGTLGICLLMILTLFTEEYIHFDDKIFIVLIMGCIILERASFKIGEFTVTLDTSILIGTYFILGLIPALWPILIALFISDGFINLIPKRKAYSNIGMFILIFIIAHFTFKALGLEIYRVNGMINIFNAVVFGILIFIINWLFLFAQFTASSSKELPEGWKETLTWDFYGNFIVIPLSILLAQVYYRYDTIGVILFLLLIILASLLFKTFRNLVFMNNELRVVQEVAASISSRLDLSSTTSNILKGINELVNSDCSILLVFDKELSKLKVLDYRIEDDFNININNVVNYLRSEIRDLIQYKKSIVVENVKRSRITKDIEMLSKDIGSLIYEPLILENEIIGCLIICSKIRGFFSKEQLYILDILANQAVIAIENARLYKEAHNKAIKDGLTGLYNQRYFYDVLDSITNNCEQCHRTKCIGCNKISLIIFDIDHFKLINDTYGHQTGDKVLKDISNIIKNNVRSTDIVSRYGGEEFTVILPNTSQLEAYEIAERIRRIIEETKFYSVDGEEIKLTISGGISQYPDSAESSTTLLAYADRAMYSGAKKQGRNKISIYVN